MRKRDSIGSGQGDITQALKEDSRVSIQVALARRYRIRNR